MKLSYFLLLKCLVFVHLLLSGCSKTSDYSGYIYILSRSSDTKEGDLVLKYNNTSNLISHVGFAFVFNKTASVYNISYDEVDAFGSSLLQQPLDEFWVSPEPANNRIWRIALSREEFEKCDSLLQYYLSKEIHYDLTHGTTDGLYCSEFIYRILQSANPQKFALNPSCRKMEGVERLMIGMDTLCYYSADFFLEYDAIEEIFVTTEQSTIVR